MPPKRPDCVNNLIGSPPPDDIQVPGFQDDISQIITNNETVENIEQRLRSNIGNPESGKKTIQEIRKMLQSLPKNERNEILDELDKRAIGYYQIYQEKEDRASKELGDLIRGLTLQQYS